MSVRCRALVSAAVAASVALGVPGPASAEPARAGVLSGWALSQFPDFGALPDSRQLALPVMLRGTLREPSGEPLNQAQVLVSAWPSTKAVAALPKGGQFDLVPIARTVADRGGRYELRSLLTPLLASLVGPDGLDIQLDVFHDDRHHTYLSQVQMNGARWIHKVVNGVDGQAAPAPGDLRYQPARPRAAPEQGRAPQRLWRQLPRPGRLPSGRVNRRCPGGTSPLPVDLPAPDQRRSMPTH